MLAATGREGAGQRFLIQHSAGSGKSNTITWLAYQLMIVNESSGTIRQLQKSHLPQISQIPLGQTKFDLIIVVTDRVNLDKQIRDLPRRMQQDDGFVNAVRSDNNQVAQIHFNTMNQQIVATMGEEKLEFMLQYSV